MSAKTHQSGTGLSLTRVKPKRGKVRHAPAAAVTDQALAPREGLLAHAWRDRDLGWLDFNPRVLHEALDEHTPLLERFKFLTIFTSNLDEFYMKRVGLLRGVAEVQSEDDPAARGGARGRLAQIRKTVLEQLAEQARCYPAWIPLKVDVTPGERRFLRLDDLIRHSADKLFPGMELIHATLFRILRNAEIELDEEEESLREAVTEALQQRRFQPVVRMDLAPDAIPALRQGLMERFELSDDDVYELPGLLDYTGLFQRSARTSPMG